MAKRKSKKRKGRNRRKKGGSLTVLIIAICIIVAVVVISKVKKGEPVRYMKAQLVLDINSAGDKAGQLNSPRGVAVSGDNIIYVADLNNSRIVKYSTDGKYLGSFGKKGEKVGEFKEPSGVAVDSENSVYIADAWNGRIQKFDSKGKFKLQIGGSKAGFYSPRNCNVNRYGILYVADTGTSRVHRFDTEGNRLGNPAGGQGKAPDKFNEVFSIAFDSQNRVYVSDAGNKRVVILTSDLKPIGKINVRAWSDTMPLWPMIAIDSNDMLYAVSSSEKDITVYNVKDKKPKYVGTIKNDMKDKPLFSDPVGIAADKNNNLYVTEVSRNKVLKILPVFEQQ